MKSTSMEDMSSSEDTSQPDLEAGEAKKSRKTFSKCVKIDMSGAINLDATVKTHTEKTTDTIYSLEDWELDAHSPSSPPARKIFVDSDGVKKLNSTLVIESENTNLGSNDAVERNDYHARPEKSRPRRKKMEKELSIWDVAKDPMEEIRRLRKELEESRSKNRSLRERLSKITFGSSLKFQLIAAFTAGFIGYSPPLWFEMGMALQWMTCCGCNCIRRWRDAKSNESMDSSDVILGTDTDTSPAIPLQTKWLRIRAFLRLSTFFLIFLVDFSDAIVDFVAPSRELLGYTLEENEDLPILRGWAIYYLLATVFGRSLGGMFAVVYQHIDESDRELTYILVELTILWVEDFAATAFLMVKVANYGYVYSTLDIVNAGLSGICMMIFIVSTLCRYRSIIDGLPRCVSCIILPFLSFNVIVMCLMTIDNATGTNLTDFWGNLFRSDRDVIDVNEHSTIDENKFRIAAIVWVLVHLYMLYCWGHHLHRKKIKQEHQGEEEEQQQDLEHGNSMPMSEIDSCSCE